MGDRYTIKSQRTYKQFFDLSQDMLCVAGLDGYFKLVNPACEKTLGYSKEEFLTKPFLEFVHPEDRACNISELEVLRQGGHVVYCEHRYVLKDGSLKWIGWTCFSDLQHGLIYAIGRDVTERKKSEEALRNANDELERRVEKRTAELVRTNRELKDQIRERQLLQLKLIQANKMAAIGTLASGIAHEINNPNSFIQSNINLFHKIWEDIKKIFADPKFKSTDQLIGGIPVPELLEIMPGLLSGIKDGSDRIKNIVGNLKNFSTPNNTDAYTTVHINRVVDGAVTILSHQVIKKTDNFHVLCETALPPVLGNAQQLEQVLINLIVNSLQALTDRGKGIVVSTSCHGGKHIVLQVKDEGCGMSHDILERITEPFFTTKLNSGGTGLGLSISYNIVKEHNGTMEFKSEPGKGTTVTVKLPATHE